MKKTVSILCGAAIGLLSLVTVSCAGAFLDISDGPFDYVTGPGYDPYPPYPTGFGPGYYNRPIGPLYNPLPPLSGFNPGFRPVTRPQPVINPNRPVTLPDNIPVESNGGVNGNRPAQNGQNGQRPGANTRR